MAILIKKFVHPDMGITIENAVAEVRCEGNFMFTPTMLNEKKEVEKGTSYWCSKGVLSIYVSKDYNSPIFKYDFTLEHYNPDEGCEKQLYNYAKENLLSDLELEDI